MGRNQRKWRNILLDRNFQLSFTLLLVGLAALLMALLGLWVKDVAYESTLVGQNRLEPLCADLEDAVNNPATPVPAAAPNPLGDEDLDDDPAADGDADPAATVDEANAAVPTPSSSSPPDDDATASAERPRAQVIIEDTHMELEPPVAAGPLVADPKLVADLERCNRSREERAAALWSSYRLILIVLFGAAFMLVLGLAIHGLRMTHKVAGPLFKVGLYLDKLRRGVYDQVWNLRKGDQLMEFYEHFRAAHRELSHMQADDIAILETLIAAIANAADEASNDEASGELEAALAEARELLAAKREGLQIPEDKRG